MPGHPPRWVDRLLKDESLDRGPSNGTNDQPPADSMNQDRGHVLPRRSRLRQRVAPPDRWMGPSSG